MRIALVSPYSHTYPGGVGRHVESLADELHRQGHEPRILAPWDPGDRLARAMHRGAAPERRRPRADLVPLGRTVALTANGAVSNLSFSTGAVARLAAELRDGRYDVVHVHEPNAPVVSWCAAELARGPLVGTFHTYSTGAPAAAGARLAGARRIYNRLHVRIAVSEAARWTAERFYGGRYRIVPNGVELGPEPAGPPPDAGAGLRLLFVGRAEERKGLPVLLRAFEALRGAGVPARLVVAGCAPEEVAPYLLERDGIELAGRVGEGEKRRLLGEADLLCAPSLGGESFGMVLTEAFAAGTPVVCSDIAGYRDVARDGVDGLLVPPGRPAELGEALRALAGDPGRRARMAAAARERAARFAWPRVAGEVVSAYEEAIATPAPAGRLARAAVRTGLRPADGGPPRRPRRLPPMDPPQAPRPRRARTARRAAVGAGLAAGGGLALLAAGRIGLDGVGRSLVAATPLWVLAAFALMAASMLVRAEAWHAILRAALPGARPRRRDAARATMIGVLMSATLPARLGEPSRAYIMARRLGRVRERLPLVLGTLVSQTLLNVLALAVLGGVMFATIGLFRGNEHRLVIATLIPVALLALVLVAPAALGRGAPGRIASAHRALRPLLGAAAGVRRGLTVFRRARLGARAALCQLGAWAVQWLACYVLLVAFGLDERAGLGAAAAVLFAVNVTAVLPAVPSNVGVFQAACVAVLSAYGVGHTDALAYGIILQAVEIATAVAIGMPALLSEGMTWRDMRLRALHAAPVELGPGARAAPAGGD